MNRLLSCTIAILLTLVICIAALTAPVFAISILWSEDWDSYSTGQNMHGINGWKGWDNDPTWTAYTSNVQYFSAPNSIAIAGASDLVYEFPNYGNNVLVFTTQMFVPSDFTGASYFILMNIYVDGSPYDWLTQVRFSSSSNLVIDDMGVGTLPLIKDQWVEISVETDMASDTQKFYYGGNLLYNHDWGGLHDMISIDAINLFANGSSPVYYDDLSIAKGEASIDIEKFTNGVNADTPTGPVISIGTPITWRYEVTNTGNVTLNNVQVTDDKLGTLCSSNPLPPGETLICEVYSGIAEVGQYTNVGTVTAESPFGPVSDSDPSHYLGSENGGPGPEPGIEVGGDIYPANKLIIFLPAGILAVVLLSGVIMIYRLNHIH